MLMGAYQLGDMLADPSHEVRTMDSARELVEEAFRWLQERYDQFSFYRSGISFGRSRAIW
jgi:hypothetical protein